MENEENKKSLSFTQEEKNTFYYINELIEKQYLIAIKNAYSIIRRNVKNKNEIEHGLDDLFEFLDDEDALYAYKVLCKHYWNIDRVSTSEYIKMYMDEYDPKHEKFGNKNNINNDNISTYNNHDIDER